MASMNDLLGSLDDQAQQQQQQNDKAASSAEAAQNTDKIVSAVDKAAQSTTEGLKSIKGEVEVLNPTDMNGVVESINKLNLTAFMQNEGLPQLAKNLNELSGKTQDLQDKLENEGLKKMSDQLGQVVKKLDEVSKTLSKTEVSVDAKLQKTIDNLSKSINAIDFKPSVNVSAPETKIVTTPVDLKPVVAALKDVVRAVKESEVPETAVDLSSVTSGLIAVQKAITALRFPVPNYVLPFRNSQGKADQIQLNPDGSLPTSATSSNATVQTTNRVNMKDQNTIITSSTVATTIVTADATHYLDLISLVLTNTSATGSEVQLFNDDGTTIRSVFYVPANDTRGIVFSIPFIQTAINNTWKLKTVTSIASLKVTAQFVLNS